MKLKRRFTLIATVSIIVVSLAYFVAIRISNNSTETVRIIELPTPIVAPEPRFTPTTTTTADTDVPARTTPIDYEANELVTMLQQGPLPEDALDAFAKRADEVYELMGSQVSTLNEELESMKAEDVEFRESLSAEQRRAIQEHIKSLSPEERSKLNLDGLIYVFGLDPLMLK